MFYMLVLVCLFFMTNNYRFCDKKSQVFLSFYII